MILMRTNFDVDVQNKVSFLSGNPDWIINSDDIPARAVFDEEIISFLNIVSKVLMSNKLAKKFSDVITFAFWIRKSSIIRLKDRFMKSDGMVRMGRGIAFHIAPSNVPVNFAYSLVAGLLNGNANIVRVPSKKYEQVSIIADAFNKVLTDYEYIKPYINLIRYERDKSINDMLSSFADVRIIWGGDDTIATLRKSPLPPRAVDIAFADRYSIAVIDSDLYVATDNKERIAGDFYNDTYFSDQNACTSPRVVVWTGGNIEEAKRLFWDNEHELVKKNYELQGVQAVNKLTSMYLSAVGIPGCKVEDHKDNLIIRIQVPEVNAVLMDHRDNSGFFFEYDCNDIMEIRDLCNDKRCQTIAYIGNSRMFMPLLESGVKGIDRIVPVGKTMDFDLIWDGYDLTSMLSRIVSVI